MGEREDVPMIVEASEAAKQLRVSASGMRRLLVIYEEVHGDLPRKGPKETDARILSSEVVERLGAARRLVESERFRSIAEALRALNDGLKGDLTVEGALAEFGTNSSDTPARDVSGEALGLMLAELRAMRSELSELRPMSEKLGGVESELTAMREEVASLKALPPSTPALGEVEHGLLARAAIWLERWLRRSR